MTKQEAERAVKDAFYFGLVALGISLLLTLIYATGAGLAHVAWWSWLDLAILGGLSWGIYRRNQIAAASMLIYFVGSKLIFWVGEQALIGVPVAFIIAYFFWRGYCGAAVLAGEQANRLAEPAVREAI